MRWIIRVLCLFAAIVVSYWIHQLFKEIASNFKWHQYIMFERCISILENKSVKAPSGVAYLEKPLVASYSAEYDHTIQTLYFTYFLQYILSAEKFSYANSPILKASFTVSYCLYLLTHCCQLNSTVQFQLLLCFCKYHSQRLKPPPLQTIAFIIDRNQLTNPLNPKNAPTPH